jgi:hypothetical protein
VESHSTAELELKSTVIGGAADGDDRADVSVTMFGIVLVVAVSGISRVDVAMVVVEDVSYASVDVVGIVTAAVAAAPMTGPSTVCCIKERRWIGWNVGIGNFDVVMEADVNVTASSLLSTSSSWLCKRVAHRGLDGRERTLGERFSFRILPWQLETSSLRQADDDDEYRYEDDAWNAVHPPVVVYESTTNSSCQCRTLRSF